MRFSLATIAFETFELILCQMLSSQGKNAPSNPYPHYLAASRLKLLGIKETDWGLGEYYELGPAKTYILRGTPRTCAIQTRAVTDN